MCDFPIFVALVFNIFIFLSIFRFQQNNLRLKIGMFHQIHISYREKKFNEFLHDARERVEGSCRTKLNAIN